MSALYGGRGFSPGLDRVQECSVGNFAGLRTFSPGLDLSEALSLNWCSASEPHAREYQSRHKTQLSATELLDR